MGQFQMIRELLCLCFNHCPCFNNLQGRVTKVYSVLNCPMVGCGVDDRIRGALAVIPACATYSGQPRYITSLTELLNAN